MIHEAVLSRVPLSEIARGANEFFCVRDLCAKYATFVIACLRPDGTLDYINCGHVEPLIARPPGVVSRLSESNRPVGLLPASDYSSSSVQLHPDDRIILLTDGVTEAESPDGDFFGQERLEAFAAQGMSPDEIVSAVRLLAAAARWATTARLSACPTPAVASAAEPDQEARFSVFSRMRLTSSCRARRWLMRDCMIVYHTSLFSCSGTRTPCEAVAARITCY